MISPPPLRRQNSALSSSERTCGGKDYLSLLLAFLVL